MAEPETDVPGVSLHDSLDGQVALVTGANRGIGAAIAAGLVTHGATVYAGVREPESFDAPEGQRPLRLDVTDPAHRREAAATVEREAGRLDVLVNNAGVMDTREALHEMPVESIRRTLSVNVEGPMLLTRALLPLLLATGDAATPARVVTLSSGLGQLSGMEGGMPAYRTSKVAVNGFSAYLDAEYAPDLLASAVSPGWVSTDMGGPEAPRTVEEGAATPIWLARMREGPGGVFWKDHSVRDW